jgi:hypothetical protein
MEYRLARINAGSFAANAGLRGGLQSQLFLAENRLDCWSTPFRLQVTTTSVVIRGQFELESASNARTGTGGFDREPLKHLRRLLRRFLTRQ